jgi:leucyl/phenylalanyl-tRNA---protein transferase
MIIPPDQLLEWYQRGIFPMADESDGKIYLYDPEPRAIIPLQNFHIPQSLSKVINADTFEIRVNTSFIRVIRACAERSETWISEDIVASYSVLHSIGYAHSVEAWKQGLLAGGLYGVSVGGAFFGESMFHYQRDASKVALVALVQRMKEKGMTLLDTQYITPHLQKFGAREISRAQYQSLLADALRIKTQFYP